MEEVGAVQCRCGLEAKRETVKKEGKNLGRAFYHCGQPKGGNCKFWKWAEQIETENGQRGEAEAGTEGNAVKSEASMDDKVMCKCEDVAKREVVKKEGKNKGRVFYHCGKKKGDNCKFWKWEEVLKQQRGKRKSKESTETEAKKEKVA